MVKVGLCQFNVTNDKDKNLSKAAEMIRKVSQLGAKIVCLPEIFNSPYDNEYFSISAEKQGGKTYNFLKQQAQENNIFLIGGSIPELDNKKIYNTSYVFNQEGDLIAKHRKVHLFDINIPGEIEFMESKTLSAGNEITTFETPFGKMGLAICFDIRFSEYFRLIAKEEVKAIFVPAAFNMTTGPAHWELAFRSRAVDNQVFMIGAAPARDYKSNYIAYGHSLVVDPFGNILESLGENEDYLVVDIRFDDIKDIRSKLPIVKNRRSDLYDTFSLNR
jgi:predicted amidohydrolase